jgi:hypothetical protein
MAGTEPVLKNANSLSQTFDSDRTSYMRISDHTQYPLVFKSMPHTSPETLALEIQSALAQDNRFLANDLIQQLEPTIQRIASVVCTGASLSDREEFIMESASCFF